MNIIFIFIKLINDIKNKIKIIWTNWNSKQFKFYKYLINEEDWTKSNNMSYHLTKKENNYKESYDIFYLFHKFFLKRKKFNITPFKFKFTFLNNNNNSEFNFS